MRQFVRAFAAAAVMSFIAAAPVKAAVQIYDLGIIGPGSIDYDGFTSSGGFISYLKFQLGFSGPASVSYSNTSAVGGAIVGGVLELNTCTTNCTGTTLAPTGSFINSSPLFSFGPTVQVAGFGPNFLSDGSYYLQLTGSIPGGFPALPFTGTITVSSAVPEPATWAMMLIGFAGLAFASTQRRKSAALAA